MTRRHEVKQTASRRVLYGASIVTGIIALAELIFIFVPKFQPLVEIVELVELYIGRISPAFEYFATGLVGRFSIALLLVWLSSNIALEAFSYKTDGLPLWQNISADSCAKVPRGFRRKMCASCKWSITLLGAPFLIVWALVRQLVVGTDAVTVGFITINPVIIVRYVKHLLLGLAALITISLLMTGGSIPH